METTSPQKLPYGEDKKMTTVLDVNGSKTNDPTQAVALFATVAAANNYMTFHDHTGVDYVVPAGFTLLITRITCRGSVAAGGGIIGSGTAGVAAGAVAPAGWVAFGSEHSLKCAAVDVTYPFPPQGSGCWKVLQNLYPCWYSDDKAGSTMVQAFGVLMANP
jgi:hypothetical protein